MRCCTCTLSHSFITAYFYSNNLNFSDCCMFFLPQRSFLPHFPHSFSVDRSCNEVCHICFIAVMQTAWRERKPQARIKAATDALEKNPEWVFDSNWTIKSWLFLRNNIIISFDKQGSQTECQQTYNSNYICTNSQRNPQKKNVHILFLSFLKKQHFMPTKTTDSTLVFVTEYIRKSLIRILITMKHLVYWGKMH